MYTDDTHVTLTSNNIDHLITNAHRESISISEWLRVNKLSANPKTECIIIGHLRRINEAAVLVLLNLNISGIKGAAKTKSLGVVVEEGVELG